MKVTHLIPGDPVPSFGNTIPDQTLTYMLGEEVIGSSPEVLITNTAESSFLMDFEPERGFGVESQPVLSRRPATQHILMAVGVSTSTGAQQVLPTGDSNGDHFVAVHVNVRRRCVELMDSLPTKAVTMYVSSCLRNLTLNIYGSPEVRMIFIQPPTRRQEALSMDCAVFTWANLAVRASSFHAVPCFNEVTIHGDEVNREVFKIVFYRFFS